MLLQYIWTWMTTLLYLRFAYIEGYALFGAQIDSDEWVEELYVYREKLMP